MWEAVLINCANERVPLKPREGQDEIVLGRDSSRVDCCVDEKTSSVVSRLHAKICRRDGEFFIADNNSTNGTFVNGLKIRESLLRDGDQVVFGGGANVAVGQSLSKSQQKLVHQLHWTFKVTRTCERSSALPLDSTRKEVPVVEESSKAPRDCVTSLPNSPLPPPPPPPTPPPPPSLPLPLTQVVMADSHSSSDSLREEQLAPPLKRRKAGLPSLRSFAPQPDNAPPSNLQSPEEELLIASQWECPPEDSPAENGIVPQVAQEQHSAFSNEVEVGQEAQHESFESLPPSLVARRHGNEEAALPRILPSHVQQDSQQSIEGPPLPDIVYGGDTLTQTALPHAEPMPFTGIPSSRLVSARVGRVRCAPLSPLEFTPEQWKLSVENPNLGSGGSFRLLLSMKNIRWLRYHTAAKPFFLVLTTSSPICGVSPETYDPLAKRRDQRTVALELPTQASAKALVQNILDNYMRFLTPENTFIVKHDEVEKYFRG
eukprot:RCo029761